MIPHMLRIIYDTSKTDQVIYILHYHQMGGNVGIFATCLINVKYRVLRSDVSKPELGTEPKLNLKRISLSTKI